MCRHRPAALLKSFRVNCRCLQPTNVQTSSSSKSFTWKFRTRDSKSFSHASPASVRRLSTVRGSTLQSRAVPRTLLPSTKKWSSAHRFLRKPYIRAEWLLLRFREPLAALLALEPPDRVPSATSFHHLDHARVARHFGPCFLRATASKMTVDLDNPAFGAILRLGPMSS